MDLIRYARGARSCYFEARFRCERCGKVVKNLYERPCTFSGEDCGLLKGWYGSPTQRDDPAQQFERSQVWRFVATVAFLVGLFAVGWIRRTLS
jgi:hypothetical protein